ncbi:MAG: OsmC family peroxiredoxin [Bacteroidetes bacterium]|nr:MAG: OsmC family peroxiredoxin [Bacteroidota bacterium]
MGIQHHYRTTIKWTGNTGSGTDHYRNYERSHCIVIENKSDILGSSDPAFRGDQTKHNPEDLLVSSLSSCHMLWYLHLCAQAGVVVTHYVDNAMGIMEEAADGGGQFLEVIYGHQFQSSKNHRPKKALKSPLALCFTELG